MPQFFKLLIDFAVNTTQVSLEDQTRILLGGIAKLLPYVGITALQVRLAYLARLSLNWYVASRSNGKTAGWGSYQCQRGYSILS